MLFNFLDTDGARIKRRGWASKFDLEADLCGPAAVPAFPRALLVSELENGGVVAAF